jgi:hypothetical protein
MLVLGRLTLLQNQVLPWKPQMKPELYGFPYFSKFENNILKIYNNQNKVLDVDNFVL